MFLHEAETHYTLRENVPELIFSELLIQLHSVCYFLVESVVDVLEH